MLPSGLDDFRPYSTIRLAGKHIGTMPVSAIAGVNHSWTKHDETSIHCKTRDHPDLHGWLKMSMIPSMFLTTLPLKLEHSWRKPASKEHPNLVATATSS